ncbi:cytoskeleton protein RodZ [Veronia nyctiphanis]|uniref:Cytoskeleton protein RodZ n=1 Tax=Veronia nyctiphanis TaxID=1278244 RepID=A0A4Q0YVW7_9GAMM|nr:cytoskeleton protein RodZ [Veronia nyctiphanis]RXJ73131.1 cytoskeleton protein RodZ [Veronia nyctiphanis]
MNTEQTENNEIDLDVSNPGTVLKKARESMGLSVKDVADRLRLRVKVIEDLESNTDTDNQIPTFTRGYIRSYSKLLGLDADQLLSGFVVDDAAEPDVQQMQSFSRKTKIEKSDTHLMTLTWVILIVVVGLSAYWWWQDQNSKAEQAEPEIIDDSVSQVEPDLTQLSVTPADDTQPETQGEETTSQSVAEVTTEQNSTMEDATASVSASSDVSSNEEKESIETDVTPSVETTDPINTASAATANNENNAVDSAVETPTLSKVLMAFSADCWIDVRDGSGKRLATGIKSSGDSLELSGTPPFKFVLGAPTAVKLTYKGESVDMSKFPSGKVARFSLPK